MANKNHIIILSIVFSILNVTTAYAVTGEMTEEQLNARVLKFADDMAGNPAEKIKSFLKGYSTPEAVKELQDAKGKFDDFASTLQKLNDNKYDELAISEIRSRYESLQSGGNVKGLPSLGLIDKLWMSIKFAGEMAKAAYANEVAVQAEVLFQSMAKDTELAALDKDIPSNSSTAAKIFQKYWRGGHRAQLQSILEHEAGFKEDVYDKRIEDMRNNPKLAEKSRGISYADDYVIERIVKIIGLANTVKKKYAAIDKASRFRVDFERAYAKWKNVYPDDFQAILRVIKAEKQLKSQIPEYNKLLSEFPNALSAAEQSLESEDSGKAGTFCGDTESKYVAAREWLSMYGGTQHAALQKIMANASTKAREFCKKYSKIQDKKEADYVAKLKEEYQEYVSKNKQLCSSSGIASMQYKGPNQSDVNSYIGTLDRKIINGEINPDRLHEIKVYEGRLPAYTGSEDLEAYIQEHFSQKPHEKTRDIPDSQRELQNLVQEYWRSARQLINEVHKESSKIVAEHNRQKKECDEARKNAQPDEEVKCYICDLAGVSSAERIALNTIPDLDFSQIRNKLGAWSRYFDSAVRAAAAANDYQKAIRGLPQRDGTADDEELDPQESVDRSYEGLIKEIREVSTETLFSGSEDWYLTQISDLLALKARQWNGNYQQEAASLMEQKASLGAERASEKESFAILKEKANQLFSNANDWVARMNKAASLLDATPWKQDGVYIFKDHAQRLKDTAREVPDVLKKVRNGLASHQRSINEIGKDLPRYVTANNNRGHIADFIANSAKRLEEIRDALKEKQISLQTDDQSKYFTHRHYGDGTKKVIAKLKSDLSGIKGLLAKKDKQLVPDVFKAIDAKIQQIAKYTPIPDNGIYHLPEGKETILLPESYTKLSAKMKKSNFKEGDFSSAITTQIDVENALKFTFDWNLFDYKTVYAKHPVYLAYLQAKSDLAKFNKWIDAEKKRLAKAIDKQYVQIDKAADKLLQNPPSNAKEMWEKLDKQASALNKRYESFQERSLVKSDIFALIKKLSDMQYKIEGKQKEKTGRQVASHISKIRDQIKSLKPSASSIAQAWELMDQAATLAQQNGVSGDTNIRQLMDEMSQLASSLQSKSVGHGDASIPMDQFPGDLPPDAVLPDDGQFPDSSPGDPDSYPSDMDDGFDDPQRMASMSSQSSRQAGAAEKRAIQALYRQFSSDYTSKNLGGLLNLVSESWSSSNGSDISDLEDVLDNSFETFDKISFKISGLTVQPSGDGKYQVSYRASITGHISSQGIKHEDESQVTEVVGREDGEWRILQTSAGQYWQ